MQIPTAVIVGRPNVGKSSLFNAIYGRRVAIVEPTPGVTRDRISRVVRRDGRQFELVDTGGMGTGEELAEHVEAQIRMAIEQADLVLMVVDATAGLQPLDRQIADDLRRAGKDVLLVVNKCDNPQTEDAAADFYALGFGTVLTTSAVHRRGTERLVGRMMQRLPEGPSEPPREPMKIAFVGRRNVGKSTLVNHLAQGPRVVVSQTPGTTRDSVDVRFELDGLEFVAIDTAGVRRRKQVKNSVDFYSTARSFGSIRRADVVALMLDALLQIGRLDKQLAGRVAEQHKPCVLAVNKMDLATDTTSQQWEEYVRDQLPMMSYAPVACVSAATGENVLRLVQLAQALHEQSAVRVGTGELNRAMEQVTSQNPPPSTPSRQAHIYYATQVGVRPPTVALFTNHPDLIDEPYKRYLANSLRARFPFTSIPIRFVVRGRGGRE